MADTPDSLGVFFDFALLERDSNAASAHLAPNAGSVLSSDLSFMDWQPSLYEHPPDMTAPHVVDQPIQQWSLADMLNHPTSLPDPHAAIPVSNRPTPYNHNLGLQHAPSSSSAARHDTPTTGNPAKDTLTIPRLTPEALLPNRHTSSASWKPASAKRKGPQTRIPLEARQILEDEFASNPYPTNPEMDIIAHQASLDVKKARNWFNNTRARKKEDHQNSRMLEPGLSRNSLDALEQAGQTTGPPQPPLALYLAQSYQEEGVEIGDIQAAMDSDSFSGSGYSDRGAWSASRRGSAFESVVSSEGTVLTNYTVSSNGSRSNVSSFGRERRRGRRRMAWKESAHTHSINGVNSAGQPERDLPFFCTFCPRAFKTKYEWIRHEDSVHALRTTWICCDTKNTLLQSCPFCGQMHPDDAHMATHKYQQCHAKPEAQRTFYRRDHFVQHLHHVHFANAKHPSVRMGCQARLLATEGHNFGCKDLSMKWRRFGAPMKKDDPMLHCGFCGRKSADWSDRCEHVAQHLAAGELSRSVWWPERRENHLENLYSTTPFESFQCRYCLRVFTDIQAMNEHTHCRVWSCRFLPSFNDVVAENAGPPLCQDFPSAKAHHCHLCGAGYRAVHVEHAHNYHRFRSCNQEFYKSEEAFLQHLHNFHGASPPALLRGNAVIEQTFMRNKGASFEPVEFIESIQPCHVDFTTTFTVQGSIYNPCSNSRQDQTLLKKHSPVRRQRLEASVDQSAEGLRVQRQHADITTKSESHGPRFFRISTYVPFISSRIFYSRSLKSSDLPREPQPVFEEIPKPHLTSLVMSAGLISMAVARWAIKPQRSKDGLVELVLEEDVA